MTPRATIRLQLHRGFTFDQAAEHAAYYARLGVSHAYVSPILTARPGSLHGYDVVDPGAVNPELGGEAGLRRLVEALRREGLGLIVDIVPNHMAVHRLNGRWLDVLEHGPASRYAEFFDIDWRSPDPCLAGKLLLPVLGAPYAEILRQRQVRLRFDPEGARIVAEYGDHLLPIRRDDHAGLLAGAQGAAAGFAAQLLAARDDGPARDAAWRKLAHAGRSDPRVAEAIDAALAAVAQEAADPARLHDLLGRQHYRLVWWRIAGDEINWRRFFDINELVAVRVERPEVFDEVHAVTLRLYEEGLIDGLRVDHVDGLTDPGGYCRRLRDELASRRQRRPQDAPDGPAYLVVEKILAAGERLPPGWPVDGTTGYDFMNEVAALLHDDAGAAALSELWHGVSGRPADFAVEEEAARDEILERHFAGQLEAAADALHEAARLELASRDLSRAGLRRALVALLGVFPCYRSYATRQGACPSDAAMLDVALERARRRLGPADGPPLDWIDGLLRRPSYDAPEQGEAALRLQQLSAPLAAKAVEDTAFYRYGRLLSRNDVGFDPARLGASPLEFHRIQTERADGHPATLLATATHDHKRGEDVRARLAVLSELPALWAQQFRDWLALNEAVRPQGLAPSDEYLLYQTIVGAWPLALAPDDRDGLSVLADRLSRWQQKALREAKLRSSWMEPDTAYEEKAERFLRALLDPGASPSFLDNLARFVQAIAPAGALNGLAQALLRCTVPGVPDLYQGSELWDLSLVDPDNRSEVDFAARAGLLEVGGSVAELLPGWRNGAVKQALIGAALAARRAAPALFAKGTFEALAVEGPASGRIYGFVRRAGGQVALVAIARHCGQALLGAPMPLPPRALWEDTSVLLPAELAQSTWRDALGGAEAGTLPERVPAARLFAAAPVVLHMSR